MNVQDAIRVVRQWGPFIARTASYGTISLTVGPFTREHWVSTWAMKRWCQQSAKALEIHIDAEGMENAPTEGAFVYASNHQSMLDILVLGAVLHGDFKWAAKRELMRVPFLGWHLQLAGHVPVDRGGGPKAAAKIVSQFEEVLNAGKPLLIFPEGTRSIDLKKFKNGGFVAAVRANKPVLPVTLEGTGVIMDKGTVIDSALVKVRVGRPIIPRTEGTESSRVADLRNRTYAVVADTLVKLGGRIRDEKKSRGDASSAEETAET